MEFFSPPHLIFRDSDILLLKRLASSILKRGSREDYYKCISSKRVLLTTYVSSIFNNKAAVQEFIPKNEATWV